MKFVYFVWLKEWFGIDEEVVELFDSVLIVCDFFDWLFEWGFEFLEVFEKWFVICVVID